MLSVSEQLTPMTGSLMAVGPAAWSGLKRSPSVVAQATPPLLPPRVLPPPITICPITIQRSSSRAAGLVSRKKLIGEKGEATEPFGWVGGQTMLFEVFPEPGGCSMSPSAGRCHVLPSALFARQSRLATFCSPLALRPGSSSLQE